MKIAMQPKFLSKAMNMGLLLGALVLLPASVRAERELTIWRVAYSGDLPRVKKFLKANPKLLNAKNPETALEDALFGGKSNVVNYLLARGAKWDKNTILYPAAAGGNLELVRLFAAKGANVNGHSPFWSPTLKRDDFGYDHETPLFIARDNPRVIEFLLSKGADMYIKNAYGKTPLENAAYRQYVEAVKSFLSRGKTLSVKDKSEALMSAVNSHFSENTKQGHDQLNIAKMLVSAGADVNYKDRHGYAALYFVSEGKNLALAKFLVSKGATWNKKWIHGIDEMGKFISTVATDPPQPTGSQSTSQTPTPNLDTPEPNAGEILLSGTVVSVDAPNNKLVLKVTAFTLPDGKSAKLATPKEKIVIVNDTTLIHPTGKTDKMISGDLKMNDAVTVIGPDSGSGKELTAREIVVDRK